VPLKVTGGQVRLIVTEYLKKHPERLHKGASGLVMNALEEAFPCTGGN